MTGTASLPHILMRYFTTPSVRTARQSVSWSLFFIFLLYFTAPAYAAFAKFNIFDTVIGVALKDLPSWIYDYGKIDLVQICGKSVSNFSDVLENCLKLDGYTDDSSLLKLWDFVQSTDMIVIATPEANNLPYVVAGLVAAGGLAASLSTADGLLLAMANSLSHDLFFNICFPDTTDRNRLMVSRTLLVLIALAAASFAIAEPDDIVSMVAWAFSLAAAGNFPALFLGVWWRRTSALGAICGSVVGFTFTLTYIILTSKFGNKDKYMIWEITNTSAGIFGLPIGFILTVLVSLVTPAPSEEMMQFVDNLREPEIQEEDEEKPKSSGDSELDMANMTAASAGGVHALDETQSDANLLDNVGKV